MTKRYADSDPRAGEQITLFLRRALEAYRCWHVKGANVSKPDLHTRNSGLITVETYVSLVDRSA
jgi:hypothetical protein